MKRVRAIFMVAGMVLISGFADPALAAPPGSGSGQSQVGTSQDGTERFDFLQINVADSDGDAFTFRDGGQICFDVTIDGGSRVPSPCYTALPGTTLHAGLEATPFLRSSTYAISIASNTTGCEVTLPEMRPQDFGASGWYAIFNVTMTCPDLILPTVALPTSTLIAPLPTFVFPTMTPTIDSTTPEDTPTPRNYQRVTLRFVPADPITTPLNLPGQICARLVVNPPLAGAALADHCHTRSTAIHDYFPTSEKTFPMDSRYSSVVISNESGCTATPGAFREYLHREIGAVAEVDVIIDCLDPVEIDEDLAYSDLSLQFTDGNTALHTYAGQLCVQVLVDPPLPSGSWVGTMCEDTTPEITTWHSTDYVTLPVSSTYTATVISNDTGCVATSDVGVVDEMVGARTIGRMVVRLDCSELPATPVPDPYEAVHVEILDSTGLYRYYGGEMCFDVTITPDVPVVGNEWQCQYYAPASGSSHTILPGADGLPVTSTYTANVFSNETGCAIEQSFRAVDGEGYITLLTTCPKPATFARVSLDLYDAAGAETLDLGGELCVSVDSLPELASGGRIGELCTTSVDATDSWAPAGEDRFLYDNAYASHVTSNTSSCTAGSMSRSLKMTEDGLMLGISMAVYCDDAPATVTPTPDVSLTAVPTTGIPATVIAGTETPMDDEFYSFGVRFDDVRGDDHTYPGQLCVKVIVTPPLHSDPTVGELCSDIAWAADTWVAVAPGQFHARGHIPLRSFRMRLDARLRSILAWL